MSRGQTFRSEFIPFADEETGTEIIQLTSFPTVNTHPYFHANSFTPDSKTLIFFSHSELRRGGALEVFKVNADGSHLVQLTDARKGARSGRYAGAILSHDGEFAYYCGGGELRRVHMQSCEDETVGFIPGVAGNGLGSMSVDDGRYVCDGRLEDGTWAILIYATDGSAAGVLHQSPAPMIHVQFDRADSEDIIFWTVDPDGGKNEPYNISHLKADGSWPRVVYRSEFDGVPSAGHFMWLGRSKEIIANLLPAHWAVIRIKLDGGQPEAIAEGEHFWHSASSFDGEWIASDTLGPDTGIKLVNVATGRFATLCRSRSANGKPDWTHPHPAFSPDGRMVVYNSDRTGVPQVYLAKIPERLFAELAD